MAERGSGTVSVRFYAELIGLLQRRAVQWGCLVRSREPDAQIRQVVARFDLGRSLEPFSRCPRCNRLLETATPAQIARLAPPRVRAGCHGFTHCPACDRLYWQGSHRPGIERWMRGLGALRDP